MQLTLDEYSKKFKMSKEMINSKLRTKKLNYIVEDDTLYIIIDDEISDTPKESTMQPKSLSKPKTTVAMVLSLYQKENLQLKEKIVQLEKKIDKLIDDKEQMLRDEMSKIEKVYSTKDEQLKQVLELLNTKLLAQHHTNAVHDVEPLPQTQQAIEVEDKNKIIELKSYLKTLDLEAYQRKIIKKRFLTVYDSDIRVIKQNGKLYLDFAKYDYSDLLEY